MGVPQLVDGASVQVRGSSGATYTMKNMGGVYSCTCPAWMHQSLAIEKRTCKHLSKLLGTESESARVGTTAAPSAAKRKPSTGTDGGAAGDEGNEGEGSEPPLLLAHRWEATQDPQGFWMSEKLDGVRAYWDGRQLLSRLGNRFHAPAWFLERLPAVPLDGELWTERKQFQRTISIVRRQDQGEGWRAVRFVVFDAPAYEGPSRRGWPGAGRRCAISGTSACTSTCGVTASSTCAPSWRVSRRSAGRG